MIQTFKAQTAPFIRHLYCEHINCKHDLTPHEIQFQSTGQENHGKDKGRHYVLFFKTCQYCKERDNTQRYTQIEKAFIEDYQALEKHLT